jgi:hypothetical protein
MTCGNCGPQMVMSGYGGYGGRTVPRSQLTGPGAYEGVPLVEGQWDGVASHIPQTLEGMTVEEIDIAFANYMTAATNAFADTTFPLDGTFPPERGAALEGALEAAWGPNYGDILLTTPPEELSVMLGMPVDITAAFQEGVAMSYPKKEKKSVWPWIIGIGAVGVVASVITYAVVNK